MGAKAFHASHSLDVKTVPAKPLGDTSQFGGESGTGIHARENKLEHTQVHFSILI